jgi:hypothetical protein
MLASARRLRVFGLVGVVAVVGVLCGSALALAGTGYVPSAFEEPVGGFSVPVGVGVDTSAGSLFKGDVYVGNFGSGLVDEFSGGGKYLGQVELAGANPYQLAVDSYPGAFEGDVFVAGFGSGTVYRFGPGLVGEQTVLSGLAEAKGIAVDEAGDMFVAEGGGSVLEFNGAGEPIDATRTVDPANVVVGGLNEPQAAAVSANGEELYVATNGGGTLQYTLTGGAYVQGATLDPNPSLGVGIAPSGDVFVDQSSEVAEYESDGTQVGSLGGGVLEGGFGVAVGAAGQVYVPDAAAGKTYVFEAGETPAEPTTGQATIHGAKATLTGTLNAGGGGTTGYHFAYNTGGSCLGGGETEAGVASSGAVQGETGELEPLTRYTFCLVATNGYGGTPGAGVPFETHSVPPGVTSESFSGVTSSTATLSAQIDPRKLQTSYQFEYSTDGVQWVKAPEPAGVLSPEQGSTTVTTKVRGLQAGTAYRFRVTATNSAHETMQSEGTFSTLPAGVPGLPDGRVYEMVSPPNDENAEMYIPEAGSESKSNGVDTQQTFQVAADGNAVAYEGEGTLSGGGDGNISELSGSQYLARRSATGGWTQLGIQPPGYTDVSYAGFSSDLSVGILEMDGQSFETGFPALAPEAPGDGYGVIYSRALDEAAYLPLFTATPPNRSAGGFGASGVFTHRQGPEKVPMFAGMSDDASQVLFEANDALLQGTGPLERELQEDVKQEVQEGEDGNYLYDSADGRPSLVDVLPDGRVEGNATFGAPSIKDPGENAPDFSHVISSDGRRVFWTALKTGVVYVREDGVRTVQVSGGAARFWTATSDGQYAFYTEGGQLYRFDIENPEAREALTAASAGVEGMVGCSENGEDVYFVATAQLTAGATAGQPNLYLAHAEGTPTVTFIATLSSEDGSEMRPFSDETPPRVKDAGDWAPAVGYRTAEVTPDGDSVMFMSDRSLAVEGFPQGYPNQGQVEVYVYDAPEGKLFCASCSPSGEAGASGFVPIGFSATSSPQWISADGSRVFFDSPSPLVARDVNGVQDVYEWEREGAGSCAVGAGADGGCLYLISDGRSATFSYLIGASENGDDVFLATRARLTPEDENEEYDVYDARVDGVQRVPAVCSGAECQGVTAASSGLSTPPSAVFSGPGNPLPSSASPKVASKPKTRSRKLAAALRVCRTKPRRARALCEAQARKRYGPAGKAKKVSGSLKKGRR